MKSSIEYIPNGTQVRTTQENTAISDWTAEAKTKRKWGVNGTIIAHHDSHGLCYDIQHEDRTVGSYDPSEFCVLPDEKTLKRLRATKEADLMGCI